jgi:cell division protein FtsW
MARRSEQHHPLEYSLLLTATFCLLAGGAVMVYSASSATSVLGNGGDGTSYLVKYVAYGAIGVGVMHFIARRNLALVRRLTPLIVLGSFALVFLVLIPGFGVEVNGARRWLGAGPIQFQPSEIVKLAIVLHIAAVLAARPKLSKELRLVVVPVLGVTGVGLGLILLQPDLGTSLVIIATVAMMLIAAGLPMRQLALLGGAGAFLISIYAVIEPYRRARLTSFLDPWDQAGGAGFQAVQGQIAIGSGGFMGVGPGQSVQKIFYVPEAHTDFILAVIGEELGLVGLCGLMALYGMIGYAGLRTAKAAKGLYAKLLATGVTSLILCQALLNIYAVLGIAPLTGVPLPFVSAGSTSLIVLLSGMGLLLNVAAGGSAHLRVMKGDRGKRTEDRDRGRRDGGARRAGAGHRRRAAG